MGPTRGGRDGPTFRLTWHNNKSRTDGFARLLVFRETLPEWDRYCVRARVDLNRRDTIGRQQ